MKTPVSTVKRILIVDDEPAIRKLCHRVLTEEGFEVDVASDGRIAMAMISEQEYDLYLFDIKMPIMDGKELYEWLQEAYPSSASRVIFTTGSAIGKDTQNFLQRSGRQVLAKPFTPDELRTTLREALGVLKRS
jgi:DNA-binding response OmpR family regulator